MKKIIFILYALIILFLPKTVALADEERISQITSEGVFLYIDSSLSIKWFELPIGYFVKVLSISHNSVKVEYKSDNPSRPSCKGYILTEHLNLVDETPAVLFPNLTFTVNQNCMLYKDTDFTLSETVTQNSVVEYYGILQRAGGNTYIYGFVTTASGDKLVGYLPSSAVYDFKIPSLPIESPIESESLQISQESFKEVDNTLGNNLQLVIIIAVSSVAISIVYLLFRPSPSKAKDEAIANNDFYDD